MSNTASSIVIGSSATVLRLTSWRSSGGRSNHATGVRVGSRGATRPSPAARPRFVTSAGLPPAAVAGGRPARRSPRSWWPPRCGPARPGRSRRAAPRPGRAARRRVTELAQLDPGEQQRGGQRAATCCSFSTAYRFAWSVTEPAALSSRATLAGAVRRDRPAVDATPRGSPRARLWTIPCDPVPSRATYPYRSGVAETTSVGSTCVPV